MCSTPKSHQSATRSSPLSKIPIFDARNLSRFTEVANAAEERRRQQAQQDVSTPAQPAWQPEPRVRQKKSFDWYYWLMEAGCRQVLWHSLSRIRQRTRSMVGNL
ncbi:hypothetical protein MIB92_13055 [Aestuariirhabdus sp. Z084]|uniref:hypothetical protein n=1 Tax=Aestuariirhabdus haliotis TaxID=2918751 RepID=UPI00201B3E01|nr:hypothetical protein [Aestuariirhabdus haliotis]MCL6416581.1 hypothetical protein [Aestuariirhabdus haliotis]MCL6420552.1 hypothetical protein [Aestuariirhabdus haliotis]